MRYKVLQWGGKSGACAAFANRGSRAIFIKRWAVGGDRF